MLTKPFSGLKKILAVTALFLYPFIYTGAELPQLKFNSWELIIYRPQNTQNLNDIRCYFKAEDENGNDVTHTKIKATYEWVTIPDVVNNYKTKYYLQGGMAMHLLIQSGKYKFSVWTPKDEQYPYPSINRDDWTSNVFEYDTSNPAKVLFVYPEANDNGFYSGKWIIDHKAPEYYKFTKPKIK